MSNKKVVLLSFFDFCIIIKIGCAHSQQASLFARRILDEDFLPVR